MAWSHPETSGAAPAPRTGHAAVCLDGARVLVHGGWDYTTNDDDGYQFCDDALSILDTATWTWSCPEVVGKRPVPRVGHSLVALGGAQGGLYLFGGRSEEDEALADLHLLRPVA